MLTQIKLTNFKCFKEETAFPLSQINLLTGINGRGKSTLLQSLLLMRQSIEHDEKTKQILLNGSCVNLGNFDDVRNSNSPKNEPIIFEYWVYDKEDWNQYTQECKSDIQYQLNENKQDSMVLDIVNILCDTQEKRTHKYDLVNDTLYMKDREHRDFMDVTHQQLLPQSSSPELIEEILNSKQHLIELNNLLSPVNFKWIHYISADRFGPQEFHFKSNLTAFPNVGVRGEFTANILYKKKDDSVNDNLCLGEDAKTLITQTEAWLNQIFDGAKVEIPNSETNILEIFFNTNASKDRFKPTNVGFGYSYILPIIVSGLIAKEDEILIVENPEAHLHPKAQSRLTQFLAKVSSCGVQVFIESHSEHILNALRIAALDKIITTDDLSILYFQQANKQPVVVQIQVQDDGGIEEWPDGFFDQTDKDFDRLFGM